MLALVMQSDVPIAFYAWRLRVFSPKLMPSLVFMFDA